METMLCDINTSTQPLHDFKAFNNWDFVSEGWYIVAASKELKAGKAKSVRICGHQIALFRTQEGEAHALDAFCSHMGMDLGKGEVKGNQLRCLFHYWQFDKNGDCVDIPCMKSKPGKRHSVRSYRVEEHYGFIWVHNNPESDTPFPQIEDLKDKEIVYGSLAPFRRIAHPHVTMMNSIDEQHMRTVHKLDINLNLEIEEKDTNFKVTFTGDVQQSTFAGKMQTFLLGDKWQSSVEFIDGCMGVLTTMIGCKFLRRFDIPKGRYLFSQTFTEKGKTVVYPIIITEKRKGILGFLFAHAFVQLNRFTMKFLAHQDGRVIYPHLRFTHKGILPEFDDSSSRWIRFTNKNLKPSIWSKPHVLQQHAQEVLE